jgi:hypothetical protein
VRRLLVAAFVVRSSPILATLMKEALNSSETSVLTSATRRNIPEHTILHSHSHENLKSYVHKDVFMLWSPYISLPPYNHYLTGTPSKTISADLQNAVFCDVTPCDSCKNRRFGGT